MRKKYKLIIATLKNLESCNIPEEEELIWKKLGNDMGFDSDTVDYFGGRWFTAEELNTEAWDGLLDA